MDRDLLRVGRRDNNDWIPRVLRHPTKGILIECPAKYPGDLARYKKAHWPDENRIVHDLDDAELLIPESLADFQKQQRFLVRDRLWEVQQELHAMRVRAERAEKQQRTYSPTELMVIVGSLSILFSAVAMILLGWRGFVMADLLGLAAVLATYSIKSKTKERPDG